MYDRHMICARNIEAIVIRMSAVRLPTIGNFANAQFA
jgi:hypothetical protein